MEAPFLAIVVAMVLAWLLKPGGEFYFSDVFADRRIPASPRGDPVLRGECLGGALCTEDFRRLIAEAGCADARVVSSAPVPLLDTDIERRIGFVNFRSLTIQRICGTGH